MITQLSQLDLNKTYSYADYLTWQFTDIVELIKGKISIMSPAPNLKHQRISADLPIRNHRLPELQSPLPPSMMRLKTGSSSLALSPPWSCSHHASADTGSDWPDPPARQIS